MTLKEEAQQIAEVIYKNAPSAIKKELNYSKTLVIAYCAKSILQEEVTTEPEAPAADDVESYFRAECSPVFISYQLKKDLEEVCKVLGLPVINIPISKSEIKAIRDSEKKPVRFAEMLLQELIDEPLSCPLLNVDSSDVNDYAAGIKGMYNDGWSIVDIAQHSNLPIRTVCNALMKMGVDAPACTDDRMAIVSEWMKNRPIAFICEKLAYNETSSVRDVLRLFRYPIPRFCDGVSCSDLNAAQQAIRDNNVPDGNISGIADYITKYSVSRQVTYCYASRPYTKEDAFPLCSFTKNSSCWCEEYLKRPMRELRYLVDEYRLEEMRKRR